MTAAGEILARLAEQGIVVYPRGDRLRVRFGADELAPEARALILDYKPALLAHLGDPRILLRAAAARAARTWQGPRLKFVRARDVGTGARDRGAWPAFAASDLVCRLTLEHDCGRVSYADRCALLGAAAAVPGDAVAYRAAEVELLDGAPDALLVRVHARKCAKHPRALAVVEMAGDVARFEDGSEVSTDA